jgi:hypothetical protein
MIDYDWMDPDSFESSYYYRCEDGKIVGQVHKISHTRVWMAKIIIVNQETFLGQYVSSIAAKQAVVDYWLMQERTLLEQ